MFYNHCLKAQIALYFSQHQSVGSKHYWDLSMASENFSLFELRLNVPVNNFSVMSGQSHRLMGINQYSGDLMCFAQGHKSVPPVRIKLRTS